jgi:hypothetical protein
MKRLLAHRYSERAPIERLCLRLWNCGPRAVAQFLDEIALDHGIADEITAKLEKFQRLDVDMLAAVGGDRFALPPTRIIGGEP